MRWGDRLPSKAELYEIKKAEIVREASRFFSRSGYHGTSLAEVALALGVTKQALYYYFKDKQSLLFECSIEAHKSAIELFEREEVRRAPTAYDALSAFLKMYVEHAVESGFQFLMFLEPEALRPDQITEVMKLRDAFDVRIRGLIRNGINEGSLRDDDTKLMSFAVLGAVSWIARWFRSSGKEPVHVVADRIVHLALEGLASKAPSRTRRSSSSKRELKPKSRPEPKRGRSSSKPLP